MKNRKTSLFNCLGKVQQLFFVALFSVLAITASAQSKSVSGTVVDKAGEPVIGASVVVKGTTNGTITDFDGNFSLQGVPNDGTIQISFVGYKTQDVSVAGKSSVKVVLAEDTEMLDEVVVVGYGTMKKSDVTGALARVDSETLNNRPVNNALEALQGKAAGVDIGTSERPGTFGDVRIRGNRSLTASNSPLYVIDGVPGSIETLNPRDIESIDVLKDASATAIYGSRGANGVIIVTTKQGKEGKFSLNYSGTVTASDIVELSPAMNAAEFIEFRRWAAYNSDPTAYAHPDSPTRENDTKLFDSPLDFQTSRDNVLKGWSGGSWNPSLVTNTDWTDFVTQTAISHEHTISASGGTEALNAYGSFGYLRNEGTQKGQWYDRYTGKININVKPTKWFTMNASLNVAWTERDYGMSNTGGRSGSGANAIYGWAKTLYNHAVPYDADGNLLIQPGGENTNYTIIDEWNKSTQKTQTFRAFGHFAATFDFGEMWEPLKGLRYKINFGPSFNHSREGLFIDGTSSHKINNNGTPGVNQVSLKTSRGLSWTLDNMIMYDRTFFDKHKVGLTLLQTASKWDDENNSLSGQNMPNPSYLWNNMGALNPQNEDHKVGLGSGISEAQLESYMVRLNYGFNDRYLLTVSGRWDGASQLAEGNKWDFFPSAALAWRASEEDFLNDIDWISNLKVRFGVGTTGNAAVSRYATKGAISQIYLPFNNDKNSTLPGYTTNEPYYGTNNQLANPNMGWEKTTQYNLGIDFGFLNDRISGSLELYSTKTNDLLMGMTIPTLTGYSYTTANVGKTSNKGVELTLNAIPVQTASGFVWETNFNMAYQKDKIDELAYGKNDMVDNNWFIGESIGVHFAYDNEGIWQDTPEDHAEMAKWNANGYDFTPGNVRPKDQNGDYMMSADDRVILGNSNAHITYGWSNNFSWKGFDLSISMIGKAGYMVNIGGQAMTAHENQRKVDYWTPENPNAEWQKPILAQATSGSGDQFSSLLGYKDASYLKVRNISLGYNFSKKICTHLGLSNLKLYGQVINPGSIYQSITDYDLDVRSTLYNRSWVFGIEIGF